MRIFVGKTIATKIKLHKGVEKRCEFMKSRFLLEIEKIGVRFRSHGTNLWRHLVLSYTFPSRGEGNAKL